MTVVYNFFGGPGAGKSTLAGQLYGHLKQQRKKVEFVQEWVKLPVYKGETEVLDDQIYILGQAHHHFYTLLDKVDYIVTDSPLLLQAVYALKNLKKYTYDINLALQFFVYHIIEQYANVNFFVDRGDRSYMQDGRYHSEDEAKLLDAEIKGKLTQTSSYHTVSSIKDVLNILDSTKIFRVALADNLKWTEGHGPWVAWEEITQEVAEGPTKEIAESRLQEVMNESKGN